MSVLRPHSGLLAATQRCIDAALIALILFGVCVELNHDWTRKHTSAAAAAAAIFLLLGEARQLYTSWRLQSLDEELRNVMLVWGVTCAALIVFAFLTKLSSNYSRVATVAWFLATPAFLLGTRVVVRLALRAARKSGRNSRSVAIVGASQLGNHVMARLQESATFGLKMLGVFDDRAPVRIAGDDIDPNSIVGNLEQLVERARRGEVDYVFVSLPMRAEGRIVDLVNRLADTTASVYVIPDFFIFDLMRARLTMLGGLPAVSVYESPFDGLSGVVKRAEDLILGSILLAASALPMLVIAICLKLTSPGSILFKQQRYGLNGRVVRVWKFRTMTVSEDGNDVVTVKGVNADDPRITPIGRILRATSLDELPQLLNVIGGTMSLVGPRPHAVKVNEEFRRLVHGYMLRHKVKPGITGWAQVNGWHGDDTVEKMQKRVQHDLAYLQDWSLWLDLKILYLTAVAVFARRKSKAEVTA